MLTVETGNRVRARVTQMAGAPAFFSVSLVRVSVQRAESPKPAPVTKTHVFQVPNAGTAEGPEPRMGTGSIQQAASVAATKPARPQVSLNTPTQKANSAPSKYSTVPRRKSLPTTIPTPTLPLWPSTNSVSNFFLFGGFLGPFISVLGKSFGLSSPHFDATCTNDVIFSTIQLHK